MGQLLEESCEEIKVRNGLVDRDRYISSQTGLDEDMAYLEIYIYAEKAIFDRILYETNIAVLVREGFGSVMMTETPKFADPRIIEQIREIGSYCMTHTGVSIDKQKGYSDYFLLINPYEQDLIANLASNHGIRQKIKIKSHHVHIADLSPLMGNDRWASVSLTAKQRILSYDLKASADDPLLPNSLDHLDPFRGEQSLKPATVKNWTKHQARRFARNVGLTRL